MPFSYNDDKAIVVYDPDDGDNSRCGSRTCGHAGPYAGSSRRRNRKGIDLERVAGLLEDASRALERAAAIKRFHTQAQKNIEQASDQVRDLVSEVRDALDRLETELQG